MNILSFGEILFDLIEDKPHLGGAPLNFAAHIAQCGLQSYILSRLGNDDLGLRALESIKDLKIHTDLIQLDDNHPTGTVNVDLNDGQPEYTIHKDVAYDYISMEQVNSDILSIDFDLLYFGSLVQRNETSGKSLQQLVKKMNFKHIFYDVNLRKDTFTKEITEASLQMCTILKLNDEEVDALALLLYQKPMEFKDFARIITNEYSLDLIIITAGEKGSYIYQNNILNFTPGIKVPVKDTVGSGDAFSAAFVFKYLTTDDVIVSSETANQLGAFVASQRGAIPAYSDDIRRIL